MLSESAFYGVSAYPYEAAAGKSGTLPPFLAARYYGFYFIIAALSADDQRL